MTTILGIRQNGVSYLAADSRVCCGNPLPVRQEKIKRAGPWAIAASGEVRIFNLLDERQEELAVAADPLAVARILRRAIEMDGWEKKQGEAGSPNWGGMTLLLGSAEGLWYINCELCVTKVNDGAPIGGGSGHEYALGAWAALERANPPTPDALREAIRIAASFDPGTGGPVDVVVLGEAKGATAGPWPDYATQRKPAPAWATA